MYSLTFVYYEQYDIIRGVALTCVLIAVVSAPHPARGHASAPTPRPAAGTTASVTRAAAAHRWQPPPSPVRPRHLSRSVSLRTQGAVFLAGLVVATPAVALMTATGVFSITVQLIGFVWLLNPSE